jgi:6-phosphogluconate dehydrogenase
MNQKIGYIGLGKMGKNMVLHLLEQHIEVAVWNRSPEPIDEVVKFGAIKSGNLSDLVNHLPSPKIIWLMLPAGSIIDNFINQIIPLLSQQDLIIDGGNSFYQDSCRRAKLLATKGIRFMDIGVSGGPSGARNGACLMVGGNQTDYDEILKLIQAIAAPSAYAHVGQIGAGHFAKMVHNGIEYGMMQSIAEGAAVLKKSEFNFNLGQIFEIYNHKSVIESRLIKWTQEALTENPDLTRVSSQISHSGEGEWTINTAEAEDIETPVIKAAFTVRKQSTSVPENFRNKVVNALRGKFGRHKINLD